MQVQAWRARVCVPLRGVSTVTDHTTQLELIGRSNTAEIATSPVVVKQLCWMQLRRTRPAVHMHTPTYKTSALAKMNPALTQASNCVCHYGTASPVRTKSVC
jgi:hypothetical protein